LLALPATLITFLLTFQFGFVALALFSLLLLLHYTTLLFLDGVLFGAQFGSNTFSFIAPCLCHCSVVLVRLRSVDPLCFSGFVSDIFASKFADAFFDCTRVYELSDNRLCFLIETGSFESTIEKRRGFASVDGEQLLRILLDFLLSNLENTLGDLCFVVLENSQTRLHQPNEPQGCPTLASNSSQTCLRIES
jgi:hypothetical protein